MPSYPPVSGPGNVEVCQIVVPDKAVGAIIGAGGSMIKQIMEDSSAHVTVNKSEIFVPSFRQDFYTEMILLMHCCHKDEGITH